MDEKGNKTGSKKAGSDGHFFFHFKAFGQDFHLNVSYNAAVSSVQQIIEHHSSKGVKRMVGKESLHATGHFVNDEQSLVTLDHSAGIVSAFRLTPITVATT